MKNTIRKSAILAIAAGALVTGMTIALAAEDIVESARAGCQKEIDAFCKDVTPGEGRVLQCLAAHHDKISGRCNYVLDDASMQLQRVALAVNHLAGECKSDLEKYCASVPIGDGRVAGCLKQHEATLSATCTQAMKDTQMQVK
jgi:hypothetical protein